MSRKRKLIDVGTIPRKTTLKVPGLTVPSNKVSVLTVPVLNEDADLLNKFVFTKSGANFLSRKAVSLESSHPKLHKKGLCGLEFEVPRGEGNKFFDILAVYYSMRNIVFHKP